MAGYSAVEPKLIELLMHANETNIVNKDSQIYSLNYLDKPDDDNFKHKSHTSCLFSVILKPRVQSIDFQENFTGMRKTVDQC